MPTSSFDIVLKVAERCNLACTYCYYFSDQFDPNRNPPLISREVVEALVPFMADAARDTSVKRFDIVFHGGEPLLIKKPYFEWICRTLSLVREHGVELHLSLQTNGVLIDDEWIDIFERHGVGVGVSIDGTAAFHDAMRPDKKGRGSYHASVAGLRRLQDAVRAGRLRSAGVLAVVPSDADGGEVLSHLIDELEVTSPGLNFPRGGWDCADTLAWDANSDNRLSLVRAWTENFITPRYHLIRDFSDLLFGMISDSGAERLDLRNSKRHHILTVSSRGDMLVDDNILGQVDLPEQPLSVLKNSFVQFLESAEWKKLQNAMTHTATKCGDCAWLRTCRGGPLFNRFDEGDHRRESAICSSLEIFNEEIAGYAVRSGLTTVDDLLRRLSASPVHTSASVLGDLLAS